jgi:hypothetical protein
MQKSRVLIAALLPICLIASSPVSAKGCIRGAVVGGVAGHYAHHHAIAGAMAGCVAGHVYYKHKAQQAAAAKQAHAPAHHS